MSSCISHSSWVCAQKEKTAWISPTWWNTPKTGGHGEEVSSSCCINQWDSVLFWFLCSGGLEEMTGRLDAVSKEWRMLQHRRNQIRPQRATDAKWSEEGDSERTKLRNIWVQIPAWVEESETKTPKIAAKSPAMLSCEGPPPWCKPFLCYAYIQWKTWEKGVQEKRDQHRARAYQGSSYPWELGDKWLIQPFQGGHVWENQGGSLCSKGA